MRPQNRIFTAESIASQGRELIGPSNLLDANNLTLPLFARHSGGGVYLYADGHAKWHKRPANWDPNAAGGIPKANWTPDANGNLIAPANVYLQWLPWLDGSEVW